MKSKSASLERDFNKRSAALAEKEAKTQEKFNKLKDNTKQMGLNFKSILNKAKK
jgi:hypothetical protein